ncbi:MAG: SLC13 family permease [Gemmatimonadaceae bacterium]
MTAAILTWWPALLLVVQEGGPAAVADTTTDAVSQGIVAAVILGLFVLLTLESAHRVLIAAAAVAVLWFVTYLTPFRLMPFERTWEAVDLNVLILLSAMMALVAVLKTTGIFAWGVARLMRLTGGQPFLVLLILVWFTALLSALMDNVTTVIFVTPMALAMARQLGVRPAAFLLPVVMASNVGGTATLIGDPPNIMIGSGANIPFVAFLVNVAGPVLFMVVLLEWVSARTYSGELRAAHDGARTLPEVPTISEPVLLRWSLAITALVFVGFFTQRLTGMPPSIPAAIGATAVLVLQDVLYLRRHRPTDAERRHGILEIFEREIEWPTIAFFVFLFVVVGAAVATGLIGRVADALTDGIRVGSAALGLDDAGTLLFAALLICWAAGVLSAFIDNIPFVAVAIPIVAKLAGDLPGDTTVLWWALSLGACLGGNATPVGASANVTVLGLAERAGAHISFGQFARFGVPLAFLTLVVSSMYLALFVYAGARAAFAVCVSAAAIALSLRLTWLLLRTPAGLAAERERGG